MKDKSSYEETKGKRTNRRQHFEARDRGEGGGLGTKRHLRLLIQADSNE